MTVSRPFGLAAELAALSPRRAAMRLAWPGILENLIRVGGQTLVIAFIGRLGAESIAAYGASLQYLFLLFPIWNSLSIGTIALVSRRMGAGRPDEAAEYARQSLILGLALALLTGVVFVLFAEQLILLLGADESVARIGRPYLQLSGGANAVTTLFVIGTAALRGAGDTRSPLLITIVSVAIAIPSAYLLLPLVGLVGVGIAWIAGNSLALAWTYVLLARGRGGLRLGFGRWRFDRTEAATLLDISLPSAGEQVVFSAGVLAVGVIAVHLGTAAYAAHNVVGQIESISFLPCLGFSTAASALVGQALGMGDATRGARAAWASAQVALLWTSLAGLAFVVFAEPLLGFFTTDATVVGAGVGALRVIGFGQPAQALNFVIAGALRGAGDTRFTLKATIANWFVVRLPLALVLTFVLGLGLVGIWGAIFVDYLVRTAILVWRFRSRRWARHAY